MLYIYLAIGNISLLANKIKTTFSNDKFIYYKEYRLYIILSLYK